MQVTNYPKAELMAMADQAITKFGGPEKARVYFKATCPHCGERPAFDEPNTLYDNMECAGCGQTFPFVEGGFRLEIDTAVALDQETNLRVSVNEIEASRATPTCEVSGCGCNASWLDRGDFRCNTHRRSPDAVRIVPDPDLN
jgi:hypothetical protein